MSEPKIKEMTVRIKIADDSKWHPMFKELMLHPNAADSKYGFHINASAHGDLFAERDVLENALKSVQENDLDQYDFLEGKRIPEVDEYEDFQTMCDDAFEQAQFYRDRVNNGFGIQTSFIFREVVNGSTKQNHGASHREGEENQSSLNPS